RAARSAPEAAIRSLAIQVLGQVYTAVDGVSRWDGQIQRTLDLGWQDPDPSVRLDAAAAERECNPSRAQQHVEAALANDADAAFRPAGAPSRRRPAATPAAPAPTATGEPAAADEGPVVLPFQWTGSVAELMARFSNTTVTAQRSIDWDGETAASVVELVPDG